MLPRLDRADSQLRPLACERALHTADGSARWTAGACPWPKGAAQSALLRRLRLAEGTCVFAAVYGPRAVPPRREQADRAVVEVVVAPAAATRGLAPRSTSSCVSSAVRAVLLAGLHPRTGVTVTLQARATECSPVQVLTCVRSWCTRTGPLWRRLSMPWLPLPWTHAFLWQGSLVRAQVSCSCVCTASSCAFPRSAQRPSLLPCCPAAQC